MKNPIQRLPKRKKAFALIVAMGLMGFVMLLLLSLSALTTLEVATSSKNRDVAAARQNAYLGMLAALAELQKTAGPDAKATARADILVSSQGFSDTAMEHPYWLGIWDSSQANWDTLSAQQKLDQAQWIISGNEGLEPDDPDYLTPLVELPDDGTSAELAKAIPDYNLPAIQAKKVEIEGSGNASPGNYAYWVSGDNAKALVSVVDPESISTDVEALNRSFQVAQRTAVETVTGLANYPVNGEKLDRVINLSSGFEDWLTDDTTNANELKRARFHDLTTWSKGLLVDVKDGALKRDLTQLFEIDASFENTFSDLNMDKLENAVKEAADPTTPEPYYFVQDSLINSGSPNWSVLRDYYQHYWPATDSSKESDEFIQIRQAQEIAANGKIVLKYKPRRTTRDGLNTAPYVSDGLPYQVEYEVDTDKGENYQYTSWILPVVSQFRMSHAFAIRNDLDIHGDPIAGIVLKPVVTVYNPYNTKISINDYKFVWKQNPKITLTLTYNGGSHEISFYQAELYEEDHNGNWSIGFDGSFSIEPGESIHQAFAANRVAYHEKSGTNAAVGDKKPSMSDSWNEVHGVFFPLVDYQTADSEWTLDGASDDADGPMSIEDAEKEGKKHVSWASAWGFTQNERDILKEAVDNDAQIGIKIEYEDFGGMHAYINASNKDEVIQRIVDVWRPHTKDAPSSFSQTYDSMSAAAKQDSFNTVAFTIRTSEQPNGSGITNEPLRNLIDTNVRSIFSNSSWDGANGYSRFLSLYAADELGQNSEAPETITADNGYKLGYWGDYVDSDGERSVVLFERPREPLLSLGQLQHANLSRYHFDPTYIVGNSYASLRVPMNQASVDQFGGAVTLDDGTTENLKLFDLSYLVNDRLWDGFFFSTVEIPRDTTERNALKASLSDDSKSLSDLLLNPRMEFIGSELSDLERYEQIIDLSEENTVNDGYGPYRAASEMWVNGAFNVNSTSVEAWKAILSSTSGLQVPIYNTDGSQEIISEEGAVFSRFSRPYNRAYASTGGEGDEQFWKGYRSLTDDEVTDLAEGIVEQVKERGPFLSLSSFVNRRLTNDEYGKKGALQAALDDPSLGSNASLAVNEFPEGLNGEAVVAFKEATSFLSNNLSSTDTSSMGFPGYVLQADVLQHLGPLLTVRSDTFTIRSYGDVVDPLTNKVTGRAWCEAKVQRIPEPLEIADDASEMDEFIKPSGQFGRQFRIVSFTWLNEEEV